MPADVVWDSRALAELTAAASWYDERSPGLGKELLAQVQVTIEKIRRAPRTHPTVHHQIRRALVGRFPYLVLFECEMDFIGIVSVFHAKRHPRQSMKRAGG